MVNANVCEVLERVTKQVRPLLNKGQLPQFIPQLAKVNRMQFGMAFSGLDGQEAFSGDAETSFSIQSISKVFALELALERMGDDLWRRVSQEPSGMPFNDLLQVDQEAGAARNPFISAGALVVTDVLCSKFAQPELTLLQHLRKLAGDENVSIDVAVMRSERDSCHRNAAIAHLLKSYGRIDNSVERVLDSYCGQCAITMNCRQLAHSSLQLASVEPASNSKLKRLSATHRHSILALMLTCGMYNAAGSFAARVALPMKSGVGGGIVAIIPGVGSLCAWSPGLDSNGNSVAAGRAIELFSHHTGLTVLGAYGRGHTLVKAASAAT